MTRRVATCLLTSLLAHVLFLLVIVERRQEERSAQLLRSRLVLSSRFEVPTRLSSRLPRFVESGLDYLPSRQQSSAYSLDFAPELPSPILAGGPPKQLSSSPLAPPKPDKPLLAEESMLAPTDGLFATTETSMALDLLRFEDMARADRLRAVVVENSRSRKDVEGYVNFTYLRLDGAASYPGKALEVLARYIRHHTLMTTKLRPETNSYFLSVGLLKDPVHFLFPSQRLSGITDDRRIAFSPEELTLLRRYLLNGGFLFIDAGATSDSRRYLNDMVYFLREAVSPEGKLVKLLPSHPIYHSFYEHSAGFPGEKHSDHYPEGHAFDMEWFYPERRPCDPTPRGMFGVEIGSDLVAVISDLNLRRQWAGEGNDACASQWDQAGANATAEEDSLLPGPSIPHLQAATNVVIYALTRPGGLTRKLPTPTWQRRGRRDLLTAMQTDSTTLVKAIVALSDPLGLPASLAILISPLGSTFGEHDLRISVTTSGECLHVLDSEAQAVLVHNLISGLHEIELDYGGARASTEIQMESGRVASIAIRLSEILFVSRLKVEVLPKTYEAIDWMRRFDDLVIEEIFYGLDGNFEDLPLPE